MILHYRLSCVLRQNFHWWDRRISSCEGLSQSFDISWSTEIISYKWTLVEKLFKLYILEDVEPSVIYKDQLTTNSCAYTLPNCCYAGVAFRPTEVMATRPKSQDRNRNRSRNRTFCTLVGLCSDENEGYVRRSQDERRVKKRLAESANSASSSGPVFCWFWATKSCRIRRRTDLDPESHSWSSDVSRDTATSRFDEVITPRPATCLCIRKTTTCRFRLSCRPTRKFSHLVQCTEFKLTADTKNDFIFDMNR